MKCVSLAELTKKLVVGANAIYVLDSHSNLLLVRRVVHTHHDNGELADLLIDASDWTADPLPMVRAALEYLGIRIGAPLH